MARRKALRSEGLVRVAVRVTGPRVHIAFAMSCEGSPQFLVDRGSLASVKMLARDFSRTFPILIHLNIMQAKPHRLVRRRRFLDHRLRTAEQVSGCCLTPTTDLAQIVDPDISDVQVTKLGHGDADLLTLPHPDDPGTQRDAASEGFPNIGEGLVVTVTSGDGIVLISVRRVVAGGQTDSRLLEGFP